MKLDCCKHINAAYVWVATCSMNTDSCGVVEGQVISK